MRPQKILDKEMIQGLTKVFRSNSYDGASLQELANITGLKKASLYHRFPEGKKGMALAVLTHMDHWVEKNVFQELLNEDNSPQYRLENAVQKILELYKDGNEMCLLNTLSIDSGSALFEMQIKNGMHKWIEAFQKIGLAFNFNLKDADDYALQALIEIQGSLVVAKGTNDLAVFDDAMKKIKNRYLKI